MRTKGDLILYFFPWEGYWDELRINIFYAIYKYYIIMCRTRKKLQTSVHFETTLKYECKHIIMTNPTNKDLTNNRLPLWTGRELTRVETLELLQEVDFLKTLKKTLLLKTKMHDNFRLPILSKDYLIHRLNEIKDINFIRSNLLENLNDNLT